MTIWWLSFVDPAHPEGDRFLGVAVVEVDDEEDMLLAVRKAWQLGINPGGEVRGSVIEKAPEGVVDTLTRGREACEVENLEAFCGDEPSIHGLDPEHGGVA